MAMPKRGEVIQGAFPHGLPRVANAAASPAQPFSARATPAWVQARVGMQGAPRPVQRATNATAPPPPSAHPHAVQLPPHLAPRCEPHGGQPLPTDVRQMMESEFRADFRDVRIHVGPQAQALGATAFTHGSHIHFAPGQWDPRSQHGRTMLGRELAHVVQQRSGRVRNPFDGGMTVVHDAALEAEAERMAVRAGRAQLRAPARSVQRFSRGVAQPAFPHGHGYVLKTLRHAGHDYDVAQRGSFYQLDPAVAAECFIYDSQVTDAAGILTFNDPLVTAQFTSYLAGTLDLYRGVPRWHETFHQVRGGRIAPLGAGALPDTSTHNTKFIPFSPDAISARNFAKTKTPGFGSHRYMHFVYGYDPNDATFIVGVVAHVRVGPADAIGIINSSEIQVGGPLIGGAFNLDSTFTMGSLLSDLHHGLATHGGAIGTYGTRTFSEMYTEQGSWWQKRQFRGAHGGLIHETLSVPAAAAWIADSLRTNCHACNVLFTTTTRKHHCRVCGEIFCDACTTRRRRVLNPLRDGGREVGASDVRICNDCDVNGIPV